MTRFLLVCVGLCLPAAVGCAAGQAGAQSKTGFAFHNVEWVRCYDGDTCTFTIPNVHPLLGEKIGVRLARIDAPEVRTKCKAEKKEGYKARDALNERLSHVKVFDLREVERGKYFRLVAEVIADGENMSDWMLESGLAPRYDGGKREHSFCAGGVRVIGLALYLDKMGKVTTAPFLEGGYEHLKFSLRAQELKPECMYALTEAATCISARSSRSTYRLTQSKRYHL